MIRPDDANEDDEIRPEEEPAAGRAELEQKSSEELFATIREMDEEDDAAWDVVWVLRRRGTAEVFQLAVRFSESEHPKQRASGLRVLAQLGAGKPDGQQPFKTKSAAIAISHLEDPERVVRSSAAWALSHLCTEEAISALIRLRGDPDPDVRLAVVSCTELNRHPDAVAALIALMEDQDDDVRNWATFNLGSLIDEKSELLDSPIIRGALCKRLEDPYEDARREAIWGLAMRRDPGGLKLLLEQLESENCWSGDLMAAEETLGVARGAPVEELCRGLRDCLQQAGK